MRMRHPERGFTLIELMTVVAMIAILTVTLASVAGGKGAGKPRTTADRITGMIQFARLRAVSQRRYHMVRIEPNVISVWAADDTGFAAPAYNNPIIQGMDIPSGVVVWNVDTATDAASGSSPTQSTSFTFDITFKPDGSSSGGTVFLTDNQQESKFRVFVYKTTGAALSRENW